MELRCFSELDGFKPGREGGREVVAKAAMPSQVVYDVMSKPSGMSEWE
jgi:hypothetical protein